MPSIEHEKAGTPVKWSFFKFAALDLIVMEKDRVDVAEPAKHDFIKDFTKTYQMPVNKLAQDWVKTLK